eukprot:1851202-Alexandrium_andersonii.AAC.1
MSCSFLLVGVGFARGEAVPVYGFSCGGLCSWMLSWPSPLVLLDVLFLFVFAAPAVQFLPLLP